MLVWHCCGIHGSRPLDIRQLRYFTAVAELGSFSRASQMLRVAQPALSRQVRQLEQENGVQLLVRSARGVAPTAMGVRLLRRAKTIIEQVEEAKADLRADAAGEATTLTVGMPIAVMSVLCGLLHSLEGEQTTNVHLKLVEGFSAFIYDWLINGSLDVAILYSAPSAAVVGVPVATEELFLIGAPSSAMSGREFVLARDIASLPLVMPHRPHPTWDLLDILGVRAGRHIPVDTIGMTIDCILSGQGYSILSLAGVKRLLDAGQLVAWPIRSPAVARSVSICHASFRPWPRRNREAFDLIGSRIRQFVEAGNWPGATPVKPPANAGTAPQGQGGA